MMMSAVSCEQEQILELTFGKNLYTMLADEPVTVDVVTNVAPTADLTVELAFTGDAVMDTDYTVSATSVVIPAGEVKGSVTISPLNNYEAGRSINISMTLPAGYVAGNNATAKVTVDAKEKIYYSFESETATVADSYVVKLKLTGSVSGNEWVATADMEIPYTVSPALNDALVAETANFVVMKGENVATLTVIAGEIEGDPQKFVVSVDAEKAGERFVGGTNKSVELTVCGAMKLSKLVGTWEFVETLDLEELEMWFEEYYLLGDDTCNPALLPTHNEGFKFTIAENDGVYTLTPSAEGDWAQYFKECQIDYCAPIEDNICAKGQITGPYTTLENQQFVAEADGVADLTYTWFSLSSVYRNFDANADATGTGAIAIANDADGNLIILIKDYDQPPFGEFWWDPGYEPDMFSFASRFVKAE